MNRLDWDTLLSEHTERPRSNRNEVDARSSFESDYERIAFSSPFRRLQDKAQVFPLKRDDFVRTRLTHSVEVAAIARSMGKSIEKELIKKKILAEKHIGDIPSILESAGLAHDLGNPPFGHYGEQVVQKFFSDYFENKRDIVKLNKEQEEDFKHFDGNCQTFRILTNLQCIKDPEGMNITYATLASIMKYPFDSLEGNCKDCEVYRKKFGFYQSEKAEAEEVLKKCNLIGTNGNYRHPLAFVLEAADDIAYSAADLEDGYKKGCISLEKILAAFSAKFKIKPNDTILAHTLDKLKEIAADERYYSEERKIQQIRITLQGIMVEHAVKAFISNIDDILDMTFSDELLMKSEAVNIRKTLSEMAREYIISNAYVQKIELAGGNAIQYFLNWFTTELDTSVFRDYIISVVDEKATKKKLDGATERTYRLISKDYRDIFERKIRDNLQNENIGVIIKYSTLLMITDFVSGMTDSYCLGVFKELNGI